jgi:hypothetical protein
LEQVVAGVGDLSVIQLTPPSLTTLAQKILPRIDPDFH